MQMCPSCGCRMSGVSRFCPMCGVTVNPDAVYAARDIGEPELSCRLPEPDSELTESYSGDRSCGRGIIKALRIIAAVISVLAAVSGIITGIAHIINANFLPGVLTVLGGIIAGLLLYFLLIIWLVRYENISVIARNSETQLRLSAAQLELLAEIAAKQNEEMRLSRQSVELLKVIDGDRFDAAKQAEKQTELLKALAEHQRETAACTGEVKNSINALSVLAKASSQRMETWRSNYQRFTHAVALAISQLPERIRDVVRAEPDNADDTEAALNADSDVSFGEETSAENTDNQS